jgi:hypothetical protein
VRFALKDSSSWGCWDHDGNCAFVTTDEIVMDLRHLTDSRLEQYRRPNRKMGGNFDSRPSVTGAEYTLTIQTCVSLLSASHFNRT